MSAWPRDIKEATTLKATIVALRRDVNQLKLTGMSMIFEMVEIPFVRVEPDIPSAIIRDDIQVEEVVEPESEGEIDERIIRVIEEDS